MKKWLLEHFLPMWAKQTLLEDNRDLRRQVRILRQEREQLLAYCRGLELGLRCSRRVSIHTGGEGK